MDWGHVIKRLADEDYADRDRIVLAMDQPEHPQAVLAVRGVRASRAVGLTKFVVRLMCPPQQAIEQLKLFGKEIVPHFHK